MTTRWLVDRVSRHGLSSSGGKGQVLIDRALPEFAEAVAVDASDVGAYWFDRLDVGFDWRVDLPTYRPAAKRVFIESAAARHMQSGDGSVGTDCWPWFHRRWGVLLATTDLHREPNVVRRQAVALAAVQEFEACDPNATLSTAIDDARWGVQFFLIGDRGDRAPGLLGGGVLIVRDDGQLAACDTEDPDQLAGAARSVFVAPEPQTDESVMRANDAFDKLLAPLLFANSCLFVDNDARPLVAGAPIGAPRRITLSIAGLIPELDQAGANQPNGFATALLRRRDLFVTLFPDERIAS